MPPKSQNANPPHPNKPLGTRLMRFLVTILIAYLIALVAIRLFESHFLFFPNYPGRLEGDWHPRNLPIQDIWLTSSDSTRLHAWWILNDQAKFTFLAFHGKASNIANRAPTYEFLHARRQPTSSPSNTAATAAAMAPPASPPSTKMPTPPTSCWSTQNPSTHEPSSPMANPWVPR
jgi:hypothetical protein